MSESSAVNPRRLRHLPAARRNALNIVLKLGTSNICDETTHRPLLSTLSLVVESCVALRAQGHRVVLVSSGAIGTGLRTLNLPVKPQEMAKKQAVAAVGQGRLMSLYDDLFSLFGQSIAQILLTRHDLADRTQYLNACNTMMTLLDMGVIPIVNENDTISVAEIKFGDNDTLSAITAAMINADLLFLLTDVDCLYTADPRSNPDAKPVRSVDDISAIRQQISVTAPAGSLGTGGMITKLVAAELAAAAGCQTYILRGSNPVNIQKIVEHLQTQVVQAGVSADPTRFSPAPEDILCTHFSAAPAPLHDRKWWIMHGLHPAGCLVVDLGAARALGSSLHRPSLFAAGIVGVQGTFAAQQCVRVVFRRKGTVVDALEEVDLARGIVNYSSDEIVRLKGRRTQEIMEVLGYADADCVIHRENLVRTITDKDWQAWCAKA